MTRRVITCYHAFNFFFSLLFWAPIFYEFHRQMGLNDGEIFSIQSIYYLSFCFLELPTGFWADKYGQHKSLRWGALFLVVANLLPIYVPNFTGFLFHWLMVAVARSLVSGSASAYLYDYLEKSGSTAYYRETEGKARALSLMGRVVAWSAVGYLMAWQVTLPYWLTTIAAVIAYLVSFGFPASDAKLEMPTFRGCWDTLRETPRLVWMMMAGIAVFVLSRLIQVNLFNPILEQKSFNLESFGWIMAVTTIFEAYGSAKGDKVADRTGELKSLYVLTALLAFNTVLFPLANQAMTLVLFSAFALITGLVYPIQRKLLNDSIPRPELRATLMSVESLLDRLAASVMAGCIAIFTHYGMMDILLYVSGGIAIVLTLFLTRRLK